MNDDKRVRNDVGPAPARIGIFRRVAVERYSQPIESSQPELLAPWRVVAAAVVLGLCCGGLGVGMLFLTW